MSLSLSEAKSRLLSGEPLSWSKFQDSKAGSVQLATPGARRLLHYLLSCDQAKVAEGSEALFDGLVAAWRNSSFDPAAANAASSPIPATGCWRLARIETVGFGGLNSVDGPPFVVPFDGQNWCLEGQNGSGKTALASAILWALTGYRCRDQDGLILERGLRTPVHDDRNVQIGDWPAIVAYPPTAAKLAGIAETWVRLTFHDRHGNSAHAHRQLVAPPGADPVTEASISPALLVAPELLEIGLLMPARLARIGFGEKSQTIYDAVTRLTGLDQLAAIAEGASNLSHKSKRFMKYAVDNGIEAIETTMRHCLDRADEQARNAGFDLQIIGTREDRSYAQGLRDLAKRASDQAAALAATLASDIAVTLDTNDPADRTRIKDAVSLSRAILQESFKGVTVFDAWKALKLAHAHTAFTAIPELLRTATEKLTDATAWDKRQNEDHKLRLKALASRFFNPAPHAHEDADCPLCESKLSGEKRRALAAELNNLKKASVAAERKLADVCAEIGKNLRDALPPELNAHFALLARMQPRDAFLKAAKERFAEAPPFSDLLPGMARLASEAAATIAEHLPSFTYTPTPPPRDVPPIAKDLLEYIGNVERVSALVAWWHINREQFLSGWNKLKGARLEGGGFPAGSLEGKLASLEAALEEAAPLDGLAKELHDAATEADKWLPIHEMQRIREAISEALNPLKELRLLVTTETASSISSLSGRMQAVLDRIHFRERLSLEGAGLGKRTVQIAGSFDRGIRIDASVVANSSWLRAILWAFVLALREQAIETAGVNPFPLMVLDDPQATFDPRNKRKWAQEIASLANTDPASPQAAQVLVITHEQQFFQMLVNSEKLTGQQGMVVRPYDTSKVAIIINGDCLTRQYQEAVESNDDQKGHAYVLGVRTYCEELLRIMLRAEGPEVCNLALDGLARLMKRSRDGSVPPFTNPHFGKLLDLLGGGGGRSIGFIKDAHHKFDGTIGLAEATDVKRLWEKQLEPLLHTCFRIFDGFEAHLGDPRTYRWMDGAIELPAGNAAEMRELHLSYRGIAAAARSDGLPGDGLIILKEISDTEKERITLHDHDAYQLAAGTLDPVADVGDVIIVSNYAKVQARDLVVVPFERQLLARRYNETEIHPNLAVLTGQATDPTALVQPVIAPKEHITARRIVGTVFAKSRLPVPPRDDNAEFLPLPDLSVVRAMLESAELFQVTGRSAEPIALLDQFIMTRPPIRMTRDMLTQMDGHLVIAVDHNGARYFKRLRLRGSIIVLESLNPDGTCPAELLSLQGELGLPRLERVLEVVGVLFERP